MTFLQTIVLALIQGITEFLPVSSSAHLILVPYLFGWQDQGLRFDVATNTGTLLAVVLYFRKDLLELLRGGRRKLLGVLTLGTVPVALAGLLFFGWIAGPLRHPLVIATTSIAFGLLLGWADRAGARFRDQESLTWADGLAVGLAQALALIPGTSRSGVTMTAGLTLGLTREAAARFAFLLAIPVGALAAAKDAWELFAHPVQARELAMMVLALVVSAAAAYLIIGWLLDWVRRRNLTGFVVYRVALGFVILALYFFSP